VACTPGKEHHHPNQDSGPNQALYNEVMNVHDEVMPKMEDLYKLKRQIKKQLEQVPASEAGQRMEWEATLARLDSASQAMMVWMREFNPPPDSAGAETVRTYLEAEREKINQVKKLTLETIDKARAQSPAH